ncbi:cellular nucleic acid-binding protein [Marchantia polymorpha subsp. ruderalis]|uniref:CCHC-type domain-containing protein n=2 Tax=Marchantia polymorpha TaxID=3197 RepID=A0AAF6APQ8_MARPO|nr:hypothetical protein MARPO_0019s0115 [Marchantia polymorpha]BBM98428.1 hypothetical protein Mp_1g13450 [Marchantia polymorpha subsp. ruderalis]|eukprot:PTQ44698.1 hypothetical protein MARPO_0019s0115 [Marchantia polymorpha]
MAREVEAEEDEEESGELGQETPRSSEGVAKGSRGYGGGGGGADEDEGSVEDEGYGLNLETRRYSVVQRGEQEDGEADDDDIGDEDDSHANEDLSLHIVEKAKKRRKLEPRAADEGVVIIDGRAEEELIVEKRSSEGNSVAADECKEPLSRSDTPEEGELQEDGEGNLVLAADLFEAEDAPDEGGGKKRKKRKKEKKEKKKKKKGGDNDQTKAKSHVKEVKLLDAEESMVMRKLLRGPRYFDPPEEQDQSCYNCGKVGHLAVDCAEGRRLKPCYVCGTFGHDGRDCPQKTDCYICGKVGHIAKNCPNKGLRTPTSRGDEFICLLCGRSGHEAPTCYYEYDEQDLEQVQCYICKEFGHLSCVDIVDTSPVPVSCFMCGEMGHTGTGCTRTRRADRDRDRAGGDKDRTASLCFKCGEEGHFARECSKQRRPWPAPWPLEEQGLSPADFSTPGSKHQRRNGGVPRWMDLQSREGRWTPPARAHQSDLYAGYSRGYGSSSKRQDNTALAENNDDDYMGPIDNFVTSSKENFKSRRRKSWTAGGGGRKRP